MQRPWGRQELAKFQEQPGDQHGGDGRDGVSEVTEDQEV